MVFNNRNKAAPSIQEEMRDAPKTCIASAQACVVNRLSSIDTLASERVHPICFSGLHRLMRENMTLVPSHQLATVDCQYMSPAHYQHLVRSWSSFSISTVCTQKRKERCTEPQDGSWQLHSQLVHRLLWQNYQKNARPLNPTTR